MKTALLPVTAVAGLLLLAYASVAGAQTAAASSMTVEKAARGKYLVATSACMDCHKGEAIDYAAWKESAASALREVEAKLAAAPPEVAGPVRAELEALRRAGPHHNPAYARATASRLLETLTPR